MKDTVKESFPQSRATEKEAWQTPRLRHESSETGAVKTYVGAETAFSYQGPAS